MFHLNLPIVRSPSASLVTLSPTLTLSHFLLRLWLSLVPFPPAILHPLERLHPECLLNTVLRPLFPPPNTSMTLHSHSQSSQVISSESDVALCPHLHLQIQVLLVCPWLCSSPTPSIEQDCTLRYLKLASPPLVAHRATSCSSPPSCTLQK